MGYNNQYGNRYNAGNYGNFDASGQYSAGGQGASYESNSGEDYGTKGDKTAQNVYKGDLVTEEGYGQGQTGKAGTANQMQYGAGDTYGEGAATQNLGIQSTAVSTVYCSTIDHDYQALMFFSSLLGL